MTVHLGKVLSQLVRAEEELARALVIVGERHQMEADVRDLAPLLARWSARNATSLKPFVARYGSKMAPEPRMLRSALFVGARVGGWGLLRDLHDLSLLATNVRQLWFAAHIAAQALRDGELEGLCHESGTVTDRQLAWLKTRIRSSAAQALTVDASKLTELRASVPRRPSLLLEQAGPFLAVGALCGALLVPRDRRLKVLASLFVGGGTLALRWIRRRGALPVSDESDRRVSSAPSTGEVTFDEPLHAR